nr:thioredoxin family protein [uncultured Carboxylicivirga sp.]
MKSLFVSLLLSTLTLTSYAQVKIGDKAPNFQLLNTDGNIIALSDFSNQEGVILVFTCNHCPYAKLYEQRIINLNKKYKPLNYPVIAINPNDSVAYEVDGYSHMVEKNYAFPYLLDNKGIYLQYGATKTPHVFLLKNEDKAFKIAYIGAIDDNYQEPEKVKDKYLEMAIDAINQGKTPKYTTTKAIGCSIKPFK